VCVRPALFLAGHTCVVGDGSLKQCTHTI